jgi:hypothetical protein
MYRNSSYQEPRGIPFYDEKSDLWNQTIIGHTLMRMSSETQETVFKLVPKVPVPKESSATDEECNYTVFKLPPQPVLVPKVPAPKETFIVDYECNYTVIPNSDVIDLGLCGTLPRRDHIENIVSVKPGCVVFTTKNGLDCITGEESFVVDSGRDYTTIPNTNTFESVSELNNRLILQSGTVKTESRDEPDAHIMETYAKKLIN